MNSEIKQTNSLKRFDLLLNDLKKIFIDIKDEKELALSLYQSNARSVFFNLQGLIKIYRKITNKKEFDQLNIQIKCLEDLLGKIDFYDSYWKEFSETPAFPSLALFLIKQKYNDALKTLNNYLVQENWDKDINSKFADILAGLEKINWPNEKEDALVVAKVLSSQIKKIIEEYKTGEIDFNELEDGLHEFRRRIRWFSIQAKALNGLIQLKDDEFKESLKFYRTKEVLESKFNELPKPNNNENTINVSQSAFYALSWLISYTGDLKDKGLKVLFLQEILIEAKLSSKKEAFEKAVSILNKDKLVLKNIIDEAKIAVDQFIKTDKVLNILREDLKKYYKLK